VFLFRYEEETPFQKQNQEKEHTTMERHARQQSADIPKWSALLVEAVALLCCESLELEGADYCRGYLQNWLYQGVGFDASTIPEKSAQKIFRAADQILRAARMIRNERDGLG